MSAYTKEQNRSRRIQTLFSSKFFSLPYTYKFRNRAYTKLFNAGKNILIEHNVLITRTHKLHGKIRIGDNVILAKNVTIDYTGEVIIEDNVTLSDGVYILSHNHDFQKLADRESSSVFPVKTLLRKGCWVGARSIILPGIEVGEYAVVGAGSVVTKNVLPYTIVAGNPARLIKTLEREGT